MCNGKRHNRHGKVGNVFKKGNDGFRIAMSGHPATLAKKR